jgi:hypothetical protein
MNQPYSPVESMISQYKEGYKTSEFWVALAAGVAPVLTAAFDTSKPVNDQLNRVPWIALAYILSRAGLKVARVNSQAKLASSVTEASAMQAVPAGAFPTFDGDANGGGIDAIDTLLDLRDRGLISEEQYDELSAGVTA